MSQLGASTAGLDLSKVLGRMLPAQERSGERAPGLQGKEGTEKQRPSSSTQWLQGWRLRTRRLGTAWNRKGNTSLPKALLTRG